MRRILFILFLTQHLFVSGQLADFRQGIYLLTICKEDKKIYGKKVIDFKKCDEQTVSYYIRLIQHRDSLLHIKEDRRSSTNRQDRRQNKYKDEMAMVELEEEEIKIQIDSIERTIEQFSFFCFIDTFRFFYYSPNTYAKQNRFKPDFDLTNKKANGNYLPGFYKIDGNNITLQMNPSKKDSIMYTGFLSEAGIQLKEIYYSEPSWIKIKALIKWLNFEDPIREEYDITQVFGDFTFDYKPTNMKLSLSIGKLQKNNKIDNIEIHDGKIRYKQGEFIIIEESLNLRKNTW